MWREKALAALLIYCGSALYTLASFLHISFRSWTFWAAYRVAIPLVCVEYVFNVHGNKRAVDAGMSVFNVMTLIIVFDLLNLWLLNVFVLKQRIQHPLREVAALAMLGCAIALSGVLTSAGA